MGHKNSCGESYLISYSFFHVKIVLFEDEDEYLNEEKVYPSKQGLESFDLRPHLIRPYHLCLGVMYKP